MKFRKFALRGMIILAVAIALCALFAGTIRSLITPKVRYAPVKSGKFESITELTGKVCFPEEEKITLTVPEGLSLTVSKVLATPGKKVKKGEKLLSATVTDEEKTLASLQQEYDSATTTLENWERKNGSIRLSSGETRWMQAYETAREAEKTEREARLELVMALDPEGTGEIPEALPQDAGKEAAAAWEKWQETVKTAEAARKELQGLDRFAIAEDVWNLIQQKREAEEKQASTEKQIMELMLLSRRAEEIQAPHAGYIIAVSVEKGTVLNGENIILTMTPEKQEPVIRAEITDTKQKIQKGTAVSIPSESWGRVETKVADTGITESGHHYIDVVINQDVIYALGQIKDILESEIRLRLVSRAQEATCLVPASAVRGSDNGRYVYVGEQETSALAGTKITVRKVGVTVLAESATTVSVAEDLSRSKVLYMEDRALSEGGALMLYEE